MLMVIIFDMGYLFSGMMFFGNNSAQYATIGDGMMTLFVLLMTEFDYMDMEEANPIFAFVFFASFIILFFMVLKTVFTSMIIKVYDAIR
jgi:hypothetical protein